MFFFFEEEERVVLGCSRLRDVILFVSFVAIDQVV